MTGRAPSHTNSPTSQRNLTVALGFWKRRVAFKNPLYISTSDKIGDQIRVRRRKLALMQKELAAELGVCTDTIRFWESGFSTPCVTRMPAVFEFISKPSTPARFSSWAEEITWHRIQKGLSQRKMAALLFMSEKTISDWENNRHKPFPRSVKKVKTLLYGEQHISADPG